MRSVLLLAAGLTACQGTSPPGDLKKFTPVESLPQVAAYAGRDAQLESLEAKYVLPDGTMDLTADYKPKVHYTFRIRATDKDVSGLQPGPPGSMPKAGDWIQVFVSVEDSDYWCTGQGCATRGMERSVSHTDAKDDKTIVPACAPAEIWKLARAAGAPAEGAATIRYDATEISFRIAKPEFEFLLDAKCARLDAKKR